MIDFLDYIDRETDRLADRALDSIEIAIRRLQISKKAVEEARNGRPYSRVDIIPTSQWILEAVEFAARFDVAVNAAATARRLDHTNAGTN